MKEIVKAMLLEGIDVDTIHEVLDVILEKSYATPERFVQAAAKVAPQRRQERIDAANKAYQEAHKEAEQHRLDRYKTYEGTQEREDGKVVHQFGNDRGQIDPSKNIVAGDKVQSANKNFKRSLERYEHATDAKSIPAWDDGRGSRKILRAFTKAGARANKGLRP